MCFLDSPSHLEEVSAVVSASDGSLVTILTPPAGKYLLGHVHVKIVNNVDLLVHFLIFV